MDSSADQLKREETRYKATWLYIRKWEHILDVGMLILACTGGLCLMFSADGHIGAMLVLSMGALLTIIAAVIRPVCPRCGKKFFKDALFRDGSKRDKCVNCALPLGARYDPDRHTAVLDK